VTGQLLVKIESFARALPLSNEYGTVNDCATEMPNPNLLFRTGPTGPLKDTGQSRIPTNTLYYSYSCEDHSFASLAMDTCMHNFSTTGVGSHLQSDKALHYAFTEVYVGGDRTTNITTSTAKNRCHNVIHTWSWCVCLRSSNQLPCRQ
jgi:hypothetical protein